MYELALFWRSVARFESVASRPIHFEAVKKLESTLGEISRRDFLGRTLSLTTAALLLMGSPIRLLRRQRLTCRQCKAVIRQEVADQVVCCPNCGREWWTGGLALREAFAYRFRPHVVRHPRVRWDYAQVPFPNAQLLATSDKPVLSLKQMTFSGRRTT